MVRTRRASLRHYLMVRPTHYTVSYSINPWMRPEKPTDTALAVAQWERLRDLYLELGHRVDLLAARAGLPDMVFSANGAAVVEDRALIARFRHPQRDAESAAYLEWFTDAGYPRVRQAGRTNEGQGDYLRIGDRILAGSGFRTDPGAHAEAEEFLGLPVTGLTLVDPHYYHLDTALAVLDDDTVAYLPRAFAPESLATLRRLYPDAIAASDADAEVFGLNAVSDGRHVVVPDSATGLIEQLRARGFEPLGVDLSELLKAGGGAKCCTLDLTATAAGRG